jgi:DNA-binding transcriptional LysR family regulator
MDLGLNRLRTLRELARHGTMSAVAEAMAYTPAAVSQQLAALERAAGVALLERAGRGVRLTEAGAALARYADRILEVEEEARAAVSALATHPVARLRLGVFATAAATMVPPALRALTNRHPDLNVQTRELDPDGAPGLVGDGVVDLAFGLDYPDAPIPRRSTVEILPLRTERFRIAVPPGSKFGPRCGLAELATQTWILPPADGHYGQAIRVACRRAGFEPQASHEITDSATSIAMVAEGLGITPVTELIQRLGPTRLTLVELDEVVERSVVLVRRRSSAARPALAALVEAIRDTVLA